ncbi:MPN domain-containing protein [Formica fusca]
MEMALGEIAEESGEKIQTNPLIQIIRVPVKHANLGIRSHAMDMSTMVELTSFSTLGKIQPFLVTITTTAALLVDLHCHLTDKEICGYLGGHWDINSHNLSVTCAFPCRYSGKEKSAAAAVEAEIARAMEWKRVTLVGWYHSHPRSHASPSLRDVDSQLDYQIKMKGPSDNGYIPCVGLICSPYNMDGNCYESNFNVFWSLPPPENRPHEYPRPMLLSYTLSQEHFLSQDTLEEIRRCIEYYKSEGGIDFTANFNNNTTYLERLRCSLASKLPGRNRSNGSYWDVIREMICPGSEDGNVPEYLTMKFPLVPSSESLGPPVPQAVGLAASNAAVFLAPVNFKPDGGAIITPTSKPFVLQPSTSRDGIKKDSMGPNDAASITQIKDSTSIVSSKHISPSEIIPSFQSGELTVSVKNAKCDYDFAPADFSKLPNPLAGDGTKSRTSANSDFPLADITQQITKFSDLTKLANFSTADLAKLSSFSIADFTRTSSSSPSTYMRNIANLFGPLGKMSPAKDMEGNERKAGDFVTVDAIPSPFKTVGSSEGCRSFSASAEDYTSDRKKLEAQIDSAKISRPGEYQGTEDLTISSIKSDFGGMLDMTTLHKKQQSSQSADIGDSLNLSKDR